MTRLKTTDVGPLEERGVRPLHPSPRQHAIRQWQSEARGSSEDVSYSSERGVLEDNDISAACYSLSSSNLLREVVKSTEIVILRSS